MKLTPDEIAEALEVAEREPYDDAEDYGGDPGWGDDLQDEFEPREDETHYSDGLYYRILCGGCNDTFEVEYDPRGNTVKCDLCGHEAMVSGDY